MGLTVIEHPENRGYGGNQKTCYSAASSGGADVVVMIHPDYQYDARRPPLVSGSSTSGICDVVLGNRIRSRREALAGGMPAVEVRRQPRPDVVENVVLGQNLGDFHSGFRVYRARVLETIPFERTPTTSCSTRSSWSRRSTSASARRRAGAGAVLRRGASINFRRSVVYGLGTLRVLAQYVAQRAGVLDSPLFRRKPAGEARTSA